MFKLTKNPSNQIRQSLYLVDLFDRAVIRSRHNPVISFRYLNVLRFMISP